ncbi:MAG: tol-pal system protein YbgF [Acidobacteria bacterium RIFCSPLOWO2_02_FULL_67_36]|nr:MAG: tol-pal system protein YbgF [Acidobacteria bacterium RIFCSPLOWO2_02_FULL_67_36]OFW18656.1 MAG: tol-pal system protein YbgF [Acidobacteria bacterium RIFCSPLOWO2_12_FULL_66_21]
MKRSAWPPIVAALAILLGFPPAASATDKAHQQLMAEIRMLQEQQQQLRQMMGGLAETLKAIAAKIDDQTGATRKAFADHKLQVDAVAEGVRILREKADDTNVRLSSMTQELEAMRQTIASAPAPSVAPAAGAETGAPATAPQTGAQPIQLPPNPSPAPGTANVSPKKMYENAFADYTAGDYDLAIVGFETYIKMFPRAEMADDAQLNIGNALYGGGKNREAVAAYQKVISDYPQSDSVPVAYYKLGLAYEALKQVDLAKKSYESVIQKYPTAYEAILARQRLDNLNRK